MASKKKQQQEEEVAQVENYDPIQEFINSNAPPPVEDLIYVEFFDVIKHLLQGGQASVEEFGQGSRVFFRDNDLYLHMEGSPFPMMIALEGQVLMSKKWVIR